MRYRQHCNITTALRGPFFLTKVPRSLSAKSTRQRFGCGHKALATIAKLQLDERKYYGADLSDSRGTSIAEWDVD